MVNSKPLANIFLRYNKLRGIFIRSIKCKLTDLSVFTLILAIAISCANHNASHLSEVQNKPNVKLKVVEVTPESVAISLKNDTSQSIYASYALSPANNSANFLSNSLEKKIDGREDFEPVEPNPHFGPPPLPLASGQEILFKPFFLPKEKGTYRVKIAYLDNAEIYKLIIDKSPNLTDQELQKVLPSWKHAWSDTFEVKE
jgi:hypothetical protein